LPKQNYFFTLTTKDCQCSFSSFSCKHVLRVFLCMLFLALVS